MRRPLAISLGMLGLGAVALCLAGPLDPPHGPVGSTYKTLSQVEPRIPISAATTPGDAQSTFRITAPGSYYLTGNLVGEPMKVGIRVLAEGVTIDLMGFELRGVPGSYSGVYTGFESWRLEVRNGTVRGWGSEGISANGAKGCIFRQLRLSGNQSGIRVGAGAIISECTATENAYFGIASDDAAVITACSASYNGSSGFSISGGTSIENCTASGNGEHGIAALFQSTIHNCSANHNTQAGIFAQTGCVVRGCNAQGNTGDGIRGHNGTLITGNSCYQNGIDGDGAGIHI